MPDRRHRRRVALLLGLIAHPRKADAVFGIGMFCIVAGVFAIVLGYVVPVYLLPALTDNVVGVGDPGGRRGYALPVVVVAASCWSPAGWR